VHEIKPIITTEFNIEGYPSESFLRLVKNVKPHQVTLVPDPPDAITSNAGWDTVSHRDFLVRVITDLQSVGIRTSIFVDTNPDNIIGAKATGTNRIELYTEPYASHFPENPDVAVKPFVEAARLAVDLGLGINAGHDLNLENLNFFASKVPGLLEVSIGHALISDALYYGLENTIQMYLRQLKV
jgi:pyridoxine 5-phosphate synthase